MNDWRAEILEVSEEINSLFIEILTFNVSAFFSSLETSPF